MPNLILTTQCNRNCPYCFAHDVMKNAVHTQMELTGLIRCADMLVASKTLHTGVLGGEPTLHPQFVDFILYLLGRGIKVTVFTNGICDQDVITALEALPKTSRLRFIVNVNFPEIESRENSDRQRLFLARLAPFCDLGINLYRSDLSPLFLVDLARQTGLPKARIRLGLAQPIVNGSNLYVKKEFYPQIAHNIVALAKAGFDHKMRISLDCGFPLCSFSDKQLGQLRRYNATTKFHCSPALDISPDLQIWSCFPLAEFSKTPLSNNTRIQGLRKFFNEEKERLKKRFRQGIFPACETCRYYEQGVCDGGCLGYALMLEG